MGVLGWTGPLIALAVVTVVVALGSLGNGPELGNVGPVWACYSLLICVISGYALLRRRAGSAIDPRGGMRIDAVLHRGRWAGCCGRAATGLDTPVHGAEPTSWGSAGPGLQSLSHSGSGRRCGPACAGVQGRSSIGIRSAGTR